MSDWEHVFVCPRCGSKFAIGRDDDPGVTMPYIPKCSMGHEPVEMEQRLPGAFPITPDEVIR